MKKLWLCVLMLLVGCSYVSPDAGQEVVLIDKPLLFGHGGVQRDSVKTGLNWIWFTTDGIIVNMLPMQYKEHFDDLMSLDGVPLDFDSIIRLKVTDSVGLVERFGPGWYEKNVQAEFRNRVRQAVRKHGMNETAISTKAIDEIDKEVSESMATYIKDAKIPIVLIDVTVGRANPPDSIKNQRVETAAQQQRVLTEQQRKLAEDARQLAEKSRAASDNAYREAMNLSPDQFLKLENIKMMDRACAGGKCTMIVAGQNISPIVDVRK